MAPFYTGLVIIFVVVASAVLLRRQVISLSSPRTAAVLAMILGAIGIIISLLCVAGNGSPMIMMAVLIAASILFGCGLIAAAILHRQD